MCSSMLLLLIFALQICSAINGDVPLPTRDYARLRNADEGSDSHKVEDTTDAAGDSSLTEQFQKVPQDFFDRLLHKVVLGYNLDPLKINNYTTSSNWGLISVTTTFHNIAICGLSSVRRSGPNFIRADENGTRMELHLVTNKLTSTIYANVTALILHCSMKILLQAQSLSVRLALTEETPGQLKVASSEAKLDTVQIEIIRDGAQNILCKPAESMVESSLTSLLTTEFNATLYQLIKHQVDRLNKYVNQHTTLKL
uniref:Putative secreted protein n=1 Tax=Ixodes ricinus TaxID=34613 RepID=A0A6B0V6A4_IXORI